MKLKWKIIFFALGIGCLWFFVIRPQAAEPPAVIETVIEDVAEPKLEAWLAWLRQIFPNTEEEWLAYIKERVIPEITLKASSMILVYLLVLPGMRKIKKRTGELKEAADGITEIKREVEKTKQDMAESEKALADTTEGMKSELAAYREELQGIREILRMGFGNDEALVQKGVARKIMKLDSTLEKEQAHEENET